MGKKHDFLMKMGQKKFFIFQKCQKKVLSRGGLKWVGRGTANKQFFILGLGEKLTG